LEWRAGALQRLQGDDSRPRLRGKQRLRVTSEFATGVDGGAIAGRETRVAIYDREEANMPMLKLGSHQQSPRGAGADADVPKSARELLYAALSNMNPSAPDERDRVFADLLSRDDIAIKTDSAARDLRRSLELTDLADWQGATPGEQAYTAKNRIAYECSAILLGSLAQLARGMDVRLAPDYLALLFGAVARMSELADIMAAHSYVRGFVQGYGAGLSAPWWVSATKALGELLQRTGKAVEGVMDKAAEVFKDLAPSIGFGVGFAAVLAGLAALVYFRPPKRPSRSR